MTKEIDPFELDAPAAAPRQGAKERAEFAAMRRAMLRGFAKHDPAYSVEELAALRRGEGTDAFTEEELEYMIGKKP